MTYSLLTVLRQHAEQAYALINDRDFLGELLPDPEALSGEAVSQKSQITYTELRDASTALHGILSSQSYSGSIEVNPVTARTIVKVLNRAHEIVQESGQDPLLQVVKNVQRLGYIGIGDIYLELDPDQTSLTGLREVFANVHDGYEKAGLSPERYAADLTRALFDRAGTFAASGSERSLAKHGVVPRPVFESRDFDPNSPLGRRRKIEKIFDHLAANLPQNKNQFSNQIQRALLRAFPAEDYEVLVVLSEDRETDLVQTRLGHEKKRRLASLGVDLANIPAPDAQLIDLRNNTVIRANVLVIPRDPQVLLFESIDWNNLRFHFESLWTLHKTNLELASRVAPFSQKWDDFMQGKLDVSRVTDQDLEMLRDLAQELLRVNQGLSVDLEPFREVYAIASTMLELRAQIGQGQNFSGQPERVKAIYEASLREALERKAPVDLTPTVALVSIALSFPGSIEDKWGSVATQLARSGQFGSRDEILAKLQSGDDAAIGKIVDELRWYASETDFADFFKRSLAEYRASLNSQRGRGERPDSKEGKSNKGRK